MGIVPSSPGAIAGKAVDKAAAAAAIAIMVGTKKGIDAIKKENYLRDAAQLNEADLEKWMDVKGFLPNQKAKLRKEIANYKRRKAQGRVKRGAIRAAKIGAAGATVAAVTPAALGGGALIGGTGAAAAGLAGLGYGSYHGVQGAYHGGRQIKKGIQKKFRKKTPSRKRKRKSRKRKSRKRKIPRRKKSRKSKKKLRK
jgi:hypothetical protein